MAYSSRLYRSAVKAGHAAGVAAALSATLVLAQAPPPADLEAAVDEFRQHLQRGDVDWAAELWTGDARELVPGAVLDRDDVRRALQDNLDAGLSDFREEDTEYFQGHDTVVTTSRTVVYSGEGNPVATTRYMTLWKRVDGRWRIHREIGIPVAPSTGAGFSREP